MIDHVGILHNHFRNVRKERLIGYQRVFYEQKQIFVINDLLFDVVGQCFVANNRIDNGINERRRNECLCYDEIVQCGTIDQQIDNFLNERRMTL